MLRYYYIRARVVSTALYSSRLNGIFVFTKDIKRKQLWRFTKYHTFLSEIWKNRVCPPPPIECALLLDGLPLPLHWLHTHTPCQPAIIRLAFKRTSLNWVNKIAKSLFCYPYSIVSSCRCLLAFLKYFAAQCGITQESAWGHWFSTHSALAALCTVHNHLRSDNDIILRARGCQKCPKTCVRTKSMPPCMPVTKNSFHASQNSTAFKFFDNLNQNLSNSIYETFHYWS